MKYKENPVDIRKYKTEETDNCPVCGANRFRRLTNTHKSHEGRVYNNYYCVLCGTRYQLIDGVREESYVPLDTENYCNFDCERCVYYDCIRTNLDCVQFINHLENLNMTEEEYIIKIRNKEIKEFIRGRKNK